LIDAYYLCHISTLPNILNTPIEYITGISAQRGEMLRKELNIHTYNDLLHHFPFRHVDKTQVDDIASLTMQHEYAYVAGILLSLDLMGEGRSKRFVGKLKDNTSVIELVWFQGINYVEKVMHVGQQYYFLVSSVFLWVPHKLHILK
jgi:ATP-dependent DNA helicase RecG